ncbi:MAG: DUF7544 domain-containing protein [Planctomycetota bacterium]|jgi:hypothetical protein
MTPEQPNRISVIDPITPAIDRVKLILFKPFDLRKWFVIGFCAWLAYLGSGGGPGGGQGGGGGPQQYNVPREPHKAQIEEGINTAKEFISDNLYWIIPVAVIVVVLIIGISLLIAWLNSRGRFMFLHCVAGNKAEVKVPWHKFRKHGNSLFLFRIVLGIISLIAVGVPIIGIVVLIIMMATGACPPIASISGIVIFGLIIFVLSISLILIKKFTFDFVVPTMFLRTASCVAGWREFMSILSANKLRFALYLLFQIVIAIVIGVIIMIGFCIGCCLCCASVLLLIPYIGTVVILPLLVFKRSYSLYYLQQFGPEFDVFRPEIETAEFA